MIIRLHHSNTGTMAPENRNKGSNAPSVRSLAVDREDEAGPLVGVSALCSLQYFDTVDGWQKGH